jgi:uncharacterized protein (DUF433 family)
MSASSPTVDLLTNVIVSTQGTCGGRPRIAGHRIRVLDIYVLHELQGKSPDEIVEIYPTISLSDVHAALAYYYKHSEEIKRDYEAEDDEVTEIQRLLGPDRIIRQKPTHQS